MKIQCDVCSKGEASVFCCADEAALCDACDGSVHHANKLARKHRRFSLSPAEQSRPLCDICKERRGFVFCQEDRAILCRDCDDPIHSANQLTMKHSRFLLTGARLSAAPLSEKSINVEKSSVMIGNNNENSSSSSSSISEYLTKTIPGYRVEDLLVDDTYELHKSEEMVPLSESELVVAELPIWVPQIQTLQSFGHCDYGFGVKGLDQNQQCYDALKGIGEQWSTDDSFMVPQINTPPSSSNKRPRVSSAWDF